MSGKPKTRDTYSCDEDISAGSSEEYVPETESSDSELKPTIIPLMRPGETKCNANVRKSGSSLEKDNTPADTDRTDDSHEESIFKGHRYQGEMSTNEGNSPVNLDCTTREKGNKVLGVKSKDKRNCCYYCGKHVTRISRHLMIHGAEKEIIDIMSLKSETEKSFYLKELKLKGNFRHNVECLQKGKGNLIVMRSPRFENDASKFLPCSYCYGFLVRRELGKHCKICPYRPKNFDVPDPVAHGKLLVLPYMSCSSSEEVNKNVLMKMRDDLIKRRVEHDPLILAFGNTLLNKLRASHGEKYVFVSHRLRNLGKLLLECERLGGHEISLLELLKPVNFDLTVSSVKHLCQGEGKPKSLGLRIGHAIRKCCEIVRCQAIKLRNESQKKQAEDFLVLMDSEWSDMVSSSLLRELYDLKLNKDTALPVTSDLVKLTSFINDTLSSAIEDMIAIPCEENYFRLAKITLCKMIIFNKRRGGEVSRISLTDYGMRSKWSSKKNEDIFNSLSDLEKKLADRLDLMKVRGKRGRHVPIILTPEVVQSMDLLVKDRPYIGIKESNKYFFANKGDKYIRGHDVLHEVIVKVNLRNPSAITSTNLRKYVATVTQIVALEKEELEWVADHLGHNIEVHRDFYRLQESTLEISKVSKLLLAIENGCIHEIAGKKLSDITLEHCFPEHAENNSASMNKINEVHQVEDNKSMSDNRSGNTEILDQDSCSPVSSSEKQGKTVEETQQYYKSPQEKNSAKKKKAKGNKKHPWDFETKSKVLRYFKLFIETHKVPGKEVCEKFLRVHKIKGRGWRDVKYLVYNSFKK